ncbi:Hypothetical predicted protein [Lynx pardinus]|uniref:Uncharacterized protein n=1 Tax=Lynx pardinus TaxID=191816 RepID=A0A485N046_LYNPA|nr:Hypothetical predicted protein [Lynx pardinus]
MPCPVPETVRLEHSKMFLCPLRLEKRPPRRSSRPLFPSIRANDKDQLLAKRKKHRVCEMRNGTKDSVRLARGTERPASSLGSAFDLLVGK